MTIEPETRAEAQQATLARIVHAVDGGSVDIAIPALLAVATLIAERHGRAGALASALADLARDLRAIAPPTGRVN